MDVFSLVLRLKEEGASQMKASVDKLNRSFDEGTAKSKAYDLTVGSLKSTMMGFAGGLALGSILTKIVTHTSEAQFATAKLDAALQSTGRAATLSSAALAKHASALQRVSTFGDEAITGAQALLLTFNNLSDRALPRATEATVDLAAALGIDLQGAAAIVGKALNMPERAALALRGALIQLSTQQQETISRFMAVGNVAAAQGVIFDALEAKVKGQAAALRDTLGGALKGLSNDFGDLFEVSRSKSNGVVDAINTIADAVVGLNVALAKLGDLLDSANTKAKPLFDLLRGSATNMFAPFLLLAAQGRKATAELSAAAAASAAGTGTGTAATVTAEERIKLLTELGTLTTLNAEQQKVLRAEADRLRTAMAGANVPLATQIELARELKTVMDALPKPKEIAQKSVPDILHEFGTAYGTTRSKLPLQQVAVELAPKVALPAEGAPGMKDALAKLSADFLLGWGQMVDRMAADMGNILVDSIASAFANLTALGGTIKSAFKTLTSGLLAGLGGMLVEFGRYVIVAGTLMQRVRDALATLNPTAAIAAGVAMIAIGGLLKGAASRAFGGGGVGVGGGYTAPGAMASGPMTLGTQYYGPTSASGASTIERVNPISVTIIGPNDPSAQRQMQELLRNAKRRGEV